MHTESDVSSQNSDQDVGHETSSCSDIEEEFDRIYRNWVEEKDHNAKWGLRCTPYGSYRKNELKARGWVRTPNGYVKEDRRGGAKALAKAKATAVSKASKRTKRKAT